jgi:GNAT superfamily N-acetyltransferase
MPAVMPITLHEAQTDAEIEACYPVLAQLRPHVPPEGFVALVRRLIEGGYRMAYAADEGMVRAVAGYRFLDQLVRGRVLYVDDLVTEKGMRSKGYGEALLTRLYDLARARECTALELDSGVHRAEAHRFYFRQRMTISAFHFVRPC